MAAGKGSAPAVKAASKSAAPAPAAKKAPAAAAAKKSNKKSDADASSSGASHTLVPTRPTPRFQSRHTSTPFNSASDAFQLHPFNVRSYGQLPSDDCGRRVVVVDTSNEIGGDGDVPHPGIGGARRMQVTEPSEQHATLIEAVQNHTPQVVVVDEIGTELECAAARTISQRGVQMIATAHGHTLENVLKNPSLNDLVGGVVSVTLGDDEARKRRAQKTTLEREGPPTFGAAVEIRETGKWVVHLDVGVAVDTLLAGYAPPVELRSVDDATGRVMSRSWLGDDSAGATGFDDAPAVGFNGGGGGGFDGFSSFAQERPIGGGVGFGSSGGSFYGEAGVSGFSFPSASGPPRTAATAAVTPPARPLSSSGFAAQEVADAADKRDGWTAGKRGSAAARTASSSSTSTDDEKALFAIYPYDLDCDMLEGVIASLGLEDRVVLTNVLEDAAAVIAVKARSYSH